PILLAPSLSAQDRVLSPRSMRASVQAPTAVVIEEPVSVLRTHQTVKRFVGGGDLSAFVSGQQFIMGTKHIPSSTGFSGRIPFESLASANEHDDPDRGTPSEG